MKPRLCFLRIAAAADAQGYKKHVLIFLCKHMRACLGVLQSDQFKAVYVGYCSMMGHHC